MVFSILENQNKSWIEKRHLKCYGIDNVWEHRTDYHLGKVNPGLNLEENKQNPDKCRHNTTGDESLV